MSGLSIVAEGAGRYINWGVIQISLANLVIIGVMVLLSILANARSHDRSRPLRRRRIDRHPPHQPPSTHGLKPEQPGPIPMASQWSHHLGRRHLGDSPHTAIRTSPSSLP